MSISELFIKRPIMTTLVMMGILLFGIMAYRLLPVSDLPNVDFPTITVSASLPGASPETMASAVATPLEKQFSTIAGVDQMTSTSNLGNTSITLQFTLDRDIDAAAQDVNAAISKTLRLLPSGILPPSYQKVNPADSPIVYYAMSSKTLSLSALDEYAETFIAQRLSTVDGVAQVQVYGAAKYAVRVQLDPKALATRGIGIDEVADGIAASNVNLPTGILWGPHRAYTVEANGQLQNAAEFRPMVIAYRNGAPVRLQDVGQVLDDVQDNKSAAWYNGSRSIILAIQRQPGTNTVAVASRVRNVMANLRQQLPASVDLRLRYDRSDSIRASLNDVRFTLLLTLCLVVLVIFLFLRNLSATVIPSLALPFSLVGTFAVMYQLGYSLDNLSMMALTLCVGFVVDDAIVMLENIVRHMEHGKPAMQAAYEGAREVGFTILSMTLSLAAVFLPVLFMGGIIGRLFHEFAVTIGAAILVSGVVSLTLTPMLCSRFLRPPREAQHGSLYQASERVYQAVLGWYERTLGWVMRHRGAALATSGAIFVATLFLFVIVPKGFLPSEDNSQIFGITETLQGTSYDDMVQHQLQVMAVLQQDPNVDGTMSFLGGGTINQGRVFMQLKPRSQRKLSVDQLIRSFSGKLAGIPGIQVFLQNPPPIRIGGRLSKSLYQFTLQSPDMTALYESSKTLEGRLRALPGLLNVTSDLQIANPQASVVINRDRAAALGVTAEQVERALYDAYGSGQVSTIYTPTNQYWVVMELLPDYQRDLSALSLLYVRSKTGSLVPLASLADISSSVGPLTVNHSGQLPSVTISFDLQPGVSLGTAVAQVQRAAAQVLPSGVTTSFGGTAQAFQSSQGGLLFLLLLAVLVIYLVLGILYESFIHPLTILSALPFAGFGALATLLLFRVELSVYAFVGIIMLVGLVKKNGIMMIDFALEAQRVEGKSPQAAILEACSIRFRPIMMTTMAALMGTLPIALGVGAGSESRRPLGIAVVGGLAFSQFITLYVTPVIYLYLDQFQSWLGRSAVGRAAAGGRAPAPEAAPAD
ncbi:MAG TPA: efflux RND transporter permease subunit [Gemmatimonadales bacterium]|nr:efflux RND transporter permease subunit [Gemmatimonadales bacterium]